MASHTPSDGQQTSEAPVAGAQTSITAAPQLLAAEIDDDGVSDKDSALGDDDIESTASLRSSILVHREENGRTYHSFKDSIGYVLPNDATEQDRLDLQHHLFTLTLGDKLYLCPAGRDKPITRCLDAGTGTGMWAMDFADEHPECEVIGVDLSPIQPSFVPPNLSFQIDDLEDEWNFNRKFDFVFARMMTGSIGDWPKLMKQSFENISPGGWAEYHDICFPVQCDDGTLADDSYLKKWSDGMMESTTVFNRFANSAERYKQQMIDAGFVNVTETIFKWPINQWPADPYYQNLGMWCYFNIANGLSGISMALYTRGLGWTPDEVEVLLANVRADMRNKRIHAWWPIYVVYGQKPE